MEGAQPSLQIANMLCGMTQDKLLEVVNHCPADMGSNFLQCTSWVCKTS